MPCCHCSLPPAWAHARGAAGTAMHGAMLHTQPPTCSPALQRAATHTLSLVVLTRQVHRKGVIFRRHFRKERHWIKTITIEGVFLQVHAIKSRKTQSITNTRCANGSVCASKKGRELQTHLDHFCHVTFWSCIFC